MAKQRIAILGGGVGSMTAAFALTNQPGWAERYELTVYQEGWRLGGKGASGRNAHSQDRIEEHGLHILMGSYENAFAMLRRCYLELGRGPGDPLATWEQAFRPHDLVVLAEQVDAGWEPWFLDFPRNEMSPGDGRPLPGALDYVRLLLDWMVRILRGWPDGPPMRGLDTLTPVTPLLDDVLREGGDDERVTLGRLREQVERFLPGATASEDLQAAVDLLTARSLASALPRERAAQPRLATPLLKRLLRDFRERISTRARDTRDARRLFVMLDLTATVLIGLCEADVLLDMKRWLELDRWDTKEWLRQHGATDLTLDSAPIRGFYALGFSTFSTMGAGTFVIGSLHMLLGYKGSIFFKMMAGMGDAIFAPLYLVLSRRGVRFRFFHRVTKLVPDAGGDAVARIHVARQVTVKEGDYAPLVELPAPTQSGESGRLPCWPSEPRYEQLVEGEALRASGANLESFYTDWPSADPDVVLERGRDFDLVVLGVSIGALPHVGSELLALDARLRRNVETLETVATGAAQLWLRPELARLGWRNRSPVLSAFSEPMDTWADMTHLLPLELWPPHLRPGSLAYFCSPLPDEEPPPSPGDPGFHGYAARQKDRARRNALAGLREYVRHLWPDAATTNDPGELNWSLLVDPEDRQGIERFDSQYWHAPVSPSERYVLANAGSVFHRLSTHGTRFHNLYLAGDWTLTALPAGCVESAVMSGLHASRAISGYPRDIAGDWTPDA